MLLVNIIYEKPPFQTFIKSGLQNSIEICLLFVCRPPGHRHCHTFQLYGAKGIMRVCLMVSLYIIYNNPHFHTFIEI